MMSWCIDPTCLVMIIQPCAAQHQLTNLCNTHPVPYFDCHPLLCISSLFFFFLLSFYSFYHMKGLERRPSCTPYRLPAWRTLWPGLVRRVNWTIADATGRCAELHLKVSNGPVARIMSILAPVSLALLSTPESIAFQNVNPKPISTVQRLFNNKCKFGAPSWTYITTKPDAR